MKAVVYAGPRDIRVQDVPEPKIEKPTDAIVRITSTNICGSDIHMYEGRTDFETGRVIGHENLGEVIEVGNAVDHVKVGDMVCLPFNIACGTCRNCNERQTAFCLRTNPNPKMKGAAYGYADMGPYSGGQAQYLRVPYVDFNALVLPEDAREKENDYVMLSDIWPTGWHATELAGVKPGESVVIYGSGPVGLMAALSARVKGASKVMVVDFHPDRLRLAESIGAIPINYAKGSPVEQVLELTNGQGADAGCECVGFQAHDPQGHEHPNMTFNNLVQSVRTTAGLGIIGVFVPQDPKGPDPQERQGEVLLDWGTFWSKGLHLGTGQANVKSYNRQLCELIHTGKARPSFIVSHQLPLNSAPEAYQHFDARDNGWTKVVLKPTQG